MAAASGIGAGSFRLGPAACSSVSGKAGSASRGAAAHLSEAAEAQTKAVNQAVSRLDLSVRFKIEQPGGIVRILAVDRADGQVVRALPLEYFAKPGAATAGESAGAKPDNNA